MHSSKLAIVIPAYKSNFLRSTLESVAQQTNKDFNLYIGDDSSPEELYPIVSDFEDRIKIKYINFKDNLGSKNLVGHWERCIDLVENEEWIWLFSDDDIMEHTCVQNFYNELRTNGNSFELYHFNIQVINEKNRVIKKCSFPDLITSEILLKEKLRGNLNSYVVEFIFKKDEFFKQKRFQNFHLAWNSDIATWIKLGHKNGIKTIKNSHVYWRSSDVNISPNHSNPEVVNGKMDANKKFCLWLTYFYKERKLSFISIYPHLATWYITNLWQYKKIYTYSQQIEFLKFFFKTTNTRTLYPLGKFYLKLKGNVK